MKKVIVFGGTGWLGHKVALNFAKEGCDVTVVSRGVKGQFIERLGSIRQIQADKKCEESMREILSVKYNIIIDTVPHVDSIKHIHKFAGSELEHYIHCSSTGGYAPLPFIPCDETAPYGGFDGKSGWATKAVVDNLVMELFCKDGFPATVIRPCYITGEGMLPLDNFGNRREDFIPDLIAGNPIVLPEGGNALLQPIHVKDLA